MCGRYVITKPVSKTKGIVKSVIGVEDDENYNAHPKQNLPVIKPYTNGRTLESLQWGLTPSWTKEKDIKPLINARLETVREKVSFKNLIKTNRCVAVADGYYEWKKDHNNKIPHFLTRSDNQIIFIAAIFQAKQFCLITQQASENISFIHKRQPAILDEKNLNKYLNLKYEAFEFLNSCSKTELKFHEIKKDVNNPANNNGSLIERYEK